MDATYSPRTSQKPDVRPISFILDNMGSLGDPIVLPVRPEDLSRSEPLRATVHQTLGKKVTGWVDEFGEGLPTINISGTTGWRYNPSLGRDGFQSFEALNELVAHRYPQFRQDAIDAGRNPDDVKLIFVDLLDNFTYPVVPMQFVLRRSKSRPLLFQYQMSLQATSLSIDAPNLAKPEMGSVFGGLGALGGAISRFDSFMDQIEGWIGQAAQFVDRVITPIAAKVKTFVGHVNGVLKRIDTVVRSAGNLITGTANKLIGIAVDLAAVGRNVMRTINNIAGLPAHLVGNLGRVASAFNEVVCIFSNALRPRGVYENYEPLFGASNCSSTTGGRASSIYADSNPFESMMPPQSHGVGLSSAAMASVATLKQSDPVLSPMPIQEISRHIDEINNGPWVWYGSENGEHGVWIR